jgi:predicted metal-dependent hydrolase
MSKMSCIRYGNKRIDFNIKRSNRRKTIGIYIGPKGDVLLRSPQFLKEEKVEEIVRKRARWIIGKQELLKNHGRFASEKEFVSGEAFSYLGRQYRLKVVRSASEKEQKCKLINGRFLVGINGDLSSETSKKTVRMTLIKWYLERSEEKIPERVELYARQIGKWPERVEIKNHKRRWGSCSQNGIVRFNWKIIMAPVTILDYVIVHELCHLIHQHHSSQFWQKVEAIIPDYAKRRERLREYSLAMTAFD